jgi:HSP20 family protein
MLIATYLRAHRKANRNSSETVDEEALMQRETYELMNDQVRAIYRALTGFDMPESINAASAPFPVGANPTELLNQRFAELESLTRLIPPVAERVPPFAFSPPLDVIEAEKELLIEIAVPGVTRSDVTVDLAGRLLTVMGTRNGEKAANGRVYRHAEIPRGPFRRVVRMPHEVTAQPRVEVENGIVRIRVTKQLTASVAQA